MSRDIWACAAAFLFGLWCSAFVFPADRNPQWHCEKCAEAAASPMESGSTIHRIRRTSPIVYPANEDPQSHNDATAGPMKWRSEP